VLQYCRARLAGYKVPTAFVIEDDLPRNASGKVLKRDLRQQ
jgi:fatty-acyl-CoA synthase